MTETIMAPKVRELIEKLNAAIARHKGLLVELRCAKADQRSHEEQIGTLQRRVEERHTDLARSGSLPPEEPFEEETLVTRLASKGRFHAARVRICNESVATNQKDIQTLKDALWPALEEFGTGLLEDRLHAYEKAAIVLRDLFMDVLSIRWDCNLPNTAFLPGVVIGALPSTGGMGGAFLDSRAMVIRDLAGQMHEALQPLRAEVEQMVTCPVE